MLAIDRRDFINDDLGAFTRIPALFANAAANYESDTVYGIVTANAALSDTVALFHATHNNLTGAGTAISVPSLGVARALMRRQTTPQGAVMNLQPKFLIVPAALETIANQFVSQQYVAAKSADYNPFAGVLQVVSEARLDANSATAWYLTAGTESIDTVEYAYLEGQQGAYIETRNADIWTGACVANSEINLAGDQAILAWHVDHGNWNGVALDGLGVVGDVKAAATLGDTYNNPYPAQAVMIVDNKASAEQRDISSSG